MIKLNKGLEGESYRDRVIGALDILGVLGGLHSNKGLQGMETRELIKAITGSSGGRLDSVSAHKSILKAQRAGVVEYRDRRIGHDFQGAGARGQKRWFYSRLFIDNQVYRRIGDIDIARLAGECGFKIAIPSTSLGRVLRLNNDFYYLPIDETTFVLDADNPDRPRLYRFDNYTMNHYIRETDQEPIAEGVENVALALLKLTI